MATKVHTRTSQGTLPKKSEGGVGAVRHAIEILRCFTGEKPLLSVTELARHVGIHKSSVSRILATLEEAQYVQQDAQSQKFRLGVGLVTLTIPILSDFHLKDIVRPHLDELAKLTGETTSFNIWDGSAAVVIEQVRGPSAIAHYAPLGLRNPGHCTAAGKALLAHLNDSDISRLLSMPLTRFTAETIINRDALLRELSNVRSEGFAVNSAEFNKDICGVASVVRGSQAKVVGAVAVTVPMYRFSPKRASDIAKIVIKQVKKLSKDLGNVLSEE